MLILPPAKGKLSTPNEYYRFRLFLLVNDFNVLLRGGRMLQEFCVDIHASIDQRRIGWVKSHQDEIHSDAYHSLQDSFPFYSPENIGRCVILPSSSTLSPRHYHKMYQEAMAIVQKFDKPILFITFTGNPNWPEILRKTFADPESS